MGETRLDRVWGGRRVVDFYQARGSTSVIGVNKDEEVERKKAEDREHAEFLKRQAEERERKGTH